METYSKRLIDIFNKSVDNEIEELEDIISILSDSNSIVDTNDTHLDVKIMESRKTAFKDAKNMLAKASLKIEGVDNEKLMTDSEKRLFYKLVRFILFLRNPFKRF